MYIDSFIKEKSRQVKTYDKGNKCTFESTALRLVLNDQHSIEYTKNS